MDRRVILAIATVLSFAGVLGLYFYSSSLQPVYVGLGDIGSDDVGKVVRTSGHVMDNYLTSAGDLILELVDYEDGSSIAVYVPAHIASSIDEADFLLPGAEIEVVGEVQEYLDELELTVNSGDGVRLIRTQDEVEVTVETLARNPTLFMGHRVTVSGQIWGLESMEIYTEDGVVTATFFQLRYPGKRMEYELSCLLIGHDAPKGFFQGQPVKFTGDFEYYEKDTGYRIVSEEMTLQS